MERDNHLLLQPLMNANKTIKNISNLMEKNIKMDHSKSFHQPNQSQREKSESRLKKVFNFNRFLYLWQKFHRKKKIIFNLLFPSINNSKNAVV